MNLLEKADNEAETGLVLIGIGLMSLTFLILSNMSKPHDWNDIFVLFGTSVSVVGAILFSRIGLYIKNILKENSFKQISKYITHDKKD